jgi:hypothetical protein
MDALRVWLNLLRPAVEDCKTIINDCNTQAYLARKALVETPKFVLDPKKLEDLFGADTGDL